MAVRALAQRGSTRERRGRPRQPRLLQRHQPHQGLLLPLQVPYILHFEPSLDTLSSQSDVMSSMKVVSLYRFRAKRERMIRVSRLPPDSEALGNLAHYNCRHKPHQGLRQYCLVCAIRVKVWGDAVLYVPYLSRTEARLSCRERRGRPREPRLLQ